MPDRPQAPQRPRQVSSGQGIWGWRASRTAWAGAGLVLQRPRPKEGRGQDHHPAGERSQELMGHPGAGVRGLGEQRCEMAPSRPLPASPVASPARPGRARLPGVGRDQRAESPRPLRQESVAPGDGIHSHIPGAMVATGEGEAGLGCQDQHQQHCCQRPGRRHPLPGLDCGLYPFCLPFRASAGPKQGVHCQEVGGSLRRVGSWSQPLTPAG